MTSKSVPDDFDGCWEAVHVQGLLLDPVLLDFANERAAQKWAYRGEMFIASHPAGGGRTYFEFLQQEEETGQAIGLVGIRLRAETSLSA